MKRLSTLKPVVAMASMVSVRTQTDAPSQPFSRLVARGGLQGRPWRRLREQILIRDRWLCRCEDCDKRVARRMANEVDHIVELADGGSDDPSNLRAINDECHKLKTEREQRRRRGG